MTRPPLSIIRLIDASEQSICARIYESAWNGAMPHTQRHISVADFLRETEGELTCVSVIGKQLCGFISIWKPDWFIHHLYVDPSAQGQGIGWALLAHARNLAEKYPLGLKCQTANLKALEFYKAAGFVEAQESGEDEYGGWVRLARRPE